MIVIGVDTHKRSHTLVALDVTSGAVMGEATIVASDEGTLDAVRFAGALDEQRVWAIEDCRHVSARLERALMLTGDRVLRVAPGLTENSRRAVRQAGKSDQIDATAIARAALREGLDSLPAAFLDDQALEIRTLNDYRDQLIAERVRMINRLRWHLVQIAPDAEAEVRPAGLIGPQVRARLARRLGRLPKSTESRIAKALLKRINEIYREELELLAELKALIQNHCPALLEEHGCGPVTAAIIIGHTAGAQRFSTEASSPVTPAPPRSPPPAATPNATACTAAGTASSTARSTSSRSRAPAPIQKHAPTSTVATARARPNAKRCAVSNVTSHGASGTSSTPAPTPAPNPPGPSLPVLLASCPAPDKNRN